MNNPFAALVTINTPHEDGKGDYGAEVGALAQAGGDILVVVGYLDQGGKGIIQSSLDAGAFDKFFLPDAMIGDSLVKAIGPDLNGAIGTVPGTDSKGAEIYAKLAKKDGFEAGPYSPEAYDAAALTPSPLRFKLKLLVPRPIDHAYIFAVPLEPWPWVCFMSKFSNSWSKSHDLPPKKNFKI